MFTRNSPSTRRNHFTTTSKGRHGEIGRAPDQLKIMPGASVFIGRTAQERRKNTKALASATPNEVVFNAPHAALSGRCRWWSKLDLDGPMPDLGANAVAPAIFAVRASGRARKGLTILQLAARSAAARKPLLIKGTVSQVADELEHGSSRRRGRLQSAAAYGARRAD